MKSNMTLYSKKNFDQNFNATICGKPLFKTSKVSKCQTPNDFGTGMININLLKDRKDKL